MVNGAECYAGLSSFRTGSTIRLRRGTRCSRLRSSRQQPRRWASTPLRVRRRVDPGRRPPVPQTSASAATTLPDPAARVSHPAPPKRRRAGAAYFSFMRLVVRLSRIHMRPCANWSSQTPERIPLMGQDKPQPGSPSILFMIGRNSHGNWVVQDRQRLSGGLFVSRAEALRYARLENGNRPCAVIMVPGVFELELGPRTNPEPAAASELPLARVA